MVVQLLGYVHVGGNLLSTSHLALQMLCGLRSFGDRGKNVGQSSRGSNAAGKRASFIGDLPQLCLRRVPA